jgi:hypothetical protein
MKRLIGIAYLRYWPFLLDLHVRLVGPDNIAGKIHKDNVDICSDILTIIYKKSMETGQISLDWNHANVAPVYKKGDK